MPHWQNSFSKQAPRPGSMFLAGNIQVGNENAVIYVTCLIWIETV